MTYSEFKNLLDANRRLLEASPERYSKRLVAFSLLGLAYPCAVAALCLAAAILLAVWSFACDQLLPAALAGIALGLCLRFASHIYFAMRPPEGLPLTKADAPVLFAEIESLAKRLGARMPDAVLVDSSFNAGAANLPGRWLFSPSRNYLIVGLPLMQALDRQEFSAALAHEMAHFSLSHPSSMRLAWRAICAWSRIGAMLVARSGPLSRLALGRFADWYIPRLDALLSANSHANELDADALEASVAGAASAARALAVQSLQAKRFGFEVLRPFWEKARTFPAPPPGFFALAAKELREKRPSKEELAAFVEKARLCESLGFGTHPSLGERFASLGFQTSLPSFESCGSDAACDLLGSSEKGISERLEKRWIDSSSDAWASVYADSQAARLALSSMVNVDFAKANSLPSLLQRARLLELAFGPDSAIRPLSDILDEHPDCAEAKFNLGRILLSKDDPSGAELMLAAVEAEPVFAAFGIDMLADFYRSAGMAREYAKVIALREKSPMAPASSSLPGVLPAPAAAKPSTAAKEPAAPAEPPLPKCSLVQQTLRQDELSELLRILSENGKVERAYLALAVPSGEGEQKPFHALLVVRRFSLLAFRGEDDGALAKELAGPLSKLSSLRVLPFDACPLAFRLKAKYLVKGALVFKS